MLLNPASLTAARAIVQSFGASRIREVANPGIGKLIEYNTSCAPGFVQRAGIAAIERGEEIIAHTITRYQAARDFLYERLNTLPGNAFGPEGEGYIRWCFASSTGRLEDGVGRLARFLEKR